MVAQKAIIPLIKNKSNRKTNRRAKSLQAAMKRWVKE